uniref:UBX domain-containing protein n=1 Tax=Tanacetum cinerariifolium TaxID=118510 RepID=A0A6L2NZX0_TANCI|nr:hypothetical protein [Tanacetum cinerariifolium]
MHPSFVQEGFTEAVQRSRREFKLLFVYLHSWDDHGTEAFCKETLCSEAVSGFVNENFVAWADSVGQSISLLRQFEGPASVEDMLKELQSVLKESLSALIALEADQAKEDQNQLEQEDAEAKLYKDKASALGPEPEKGPDVTQVLVRLPNGERKGRRFHCNDTLQSIYDFVDSSGILEVGSYTLVTFFPRVLYGQDELSSTLLELGLYPQASLFVEFVRKDLGEWLRWPRKKIRYDGWRLGYVWKWKDEFRGTILKQLQRLEASLDRLHEGHMGRSGKGLVLFKWVQVYWGTMGCIGQKGEKICGLLLACSFRSFVEEILERARMQNCNPCRTPVDTESKLGPDGDLVTDSTLYRSLLHVFSTAQLTTYTDADWAGCLVTLSRFSAEAEYYGIANVVVETAWIRNLLRELHTPLFTSTLVYCDNVSAVYMLANPVQHQCTKHIEIDIHFVRDFVAKGQVRVLHVPSRLRYDDIFTKDLHAALFLEFRSSLNVRMPPVLTAEEYYHYLLNITGQARIFFLKSIIKMNVARKGY